MQRRTVLKTAIVAALAATVGQESAAETSQDSLDTFLVFIGAMTTGDMDQITALMADDMTWQNEGDTRLPWIGETKGKENILAFLGVFSSNLSLTLWENTDSFASGDTVAVFGKMNGVLTKTGQETGVFTFGLRAKVRDGQVVLWNWLEDSFTVNQAYHGSAKEE